VGVAVTNTAASARWIKIFNLAGASVTPGTTSATAEIGLSAGQTLEWSLEGGAAFSTGITIMVTGGQGLTNNTAVTAGDVTGMAFFAKGSINESRTTDCYGRTEAGGALCCKKRG